MYSVKRGNRSPGGFSEASFNKSHSVSSDSIKGVIVVCNTANEPIIILTLSVLISIRAYYKLIRASNIICSPSSFRVFRIFSQ